MLWKISDQRPLVSIRKVTTHKLPRTSSGQVCPEILSKKQVQYPCETNDGQYNSSKLYKQNGWTNIIHRMQIWWTTLSSAGMSCMKARLVGPRCFVLTRFLSSEESCFVRDLD